CYFVGGGAQLRGSVDGNGQGGDPIQRILSGTERVFGRLRSRRRFARYDRAVPAHPCPHVAPLLARSYLAQVQGGGRWRRPQALRYLRLELC
ncbi:unnamed protein product, partial [Ectocarpus sp. 12 AP-2014]